ncbi:MAG: mechanosensitive ion channel family protein [Bacteroidales bacterium]|jgi:small-conductance mechanosensitive channel|nr:mechanosensitive ion channel family protein [Bacteroidales bacterium]
MKESKAFLDRFFSHDMLIQLVTIGIKIVLIYVLLAALVFLERRIFKRLIDRREKQSIDKTNLIFIRNVMIYTTYGVGFLSMINQVPGMQQLSKTLLAGAGILAAAVGFGSQQAISNIVSGIFMVLFKPFRVGDYIDMGGGNTGTVVDISLRHTTIKNSENRMIIVPNNVLNNQSIINSSITSAATCAFIDVGIGYGSDINRAMVVMQEEAVKHPLLIDNRTKAEKNDGTPQVVVRVIEWANSSVNLRAWAWAANTGDAYVLKCDLLKSLKERFDREGIEIPFPCTNVILKKE